MVLERFDEVNIKDLVVQRPKNPEGLIFDVERDITERDWEEIMSVTDGCLQMGERGGMQASAEYLRLISQINLLSSEHAEGYIIPNNMWGWLKASLGRQFFVGNTFTASSQLVDSKRVHPIRFRELDSHWDHLNDSVKQKDGFTRLKMLANMRMLFPERFADLNVKVIDWEDAQAMFNDFPTLEGAAAIKIVFPERFNSLSITEHDLKDFKAQFVDFFKNESWLDLLIGANHLNVILAEKIDFDERGLKLTMPAYKEKFLGSDLALPIRRLF